MDGKHLLRLADRCEAGANELAYEAEHAAEILAERGYPDADAAEWANRKTAGVAAARQYAQGLRDDAAGMGAADPVDPVRVEQAGKVADAANLGGILIDGRAVAQRGVDESVGRYGHDEKVLELEHAQRKAAAIEASGMFEHVAEDGQVPFWQLGSTERAHDRASTTAAHADDDADGW